MNMYLKKEHFKERLNQAIPNSDKLFHHGERLSSKAYLFSSGSNLAIIYIDIIIFLKIGNKITLNTDGWRTHTSKKWINKGLYMVGSDWFIQQKKSEWYLKTWDNNWEIEFKDNMIIK